MAVDYEYDPEKDPDYDPEYDETFQKLAELYYLAQLDDGSRKVISFDLVKDPPQQKMQADTPEQRQAAADAVNNVLEEMIQLPALKKICDARHVDVEILTKILDNFKNSITQQTLIQLAKHDQHAHEQPGSADAVNNVSEQMTQLPASKKTRYAHDDDEEIRAGGGQ